MGKTLDFIFNLDVFMSNGFGGQFSKAAQAISGLNEKIQKLNKASGNITGFQKQTQKLEALRQKLSQAQAKVKDFQTRRKQGEIIDPKAFTRANEEAARLRGLVQENSRALGAFRNELKAAGVDTSKLGSEQERLAAKIQQAQKAQERYNSIRQRLSWGNIKGAIAEITPVVTALKAPIKLSADFESAMARVKAVAFSGEGADLSGFEAMKAQALQLGADTQFTAIQAAATQENLARAGMSAQNIMAAMPAVLNMAAAEGMDLAQAGSIIAKGLGGMNLEGKYAGRLADILAYTSANSNTNIAMLGEAFKTAAPIFASQGARMEQLAAYLGVLANKGYEGSEAGSAIASAPLRLAKQSKETKDALAKLGVAVMTREGRLRELPDIMIALDQAMRERNYGEAQQLSVIETIFGKNYGKAMMAFMQASASKDAEKMQNGVQNNSFGQSAKMANINLDTLNGQIQILGSAWDGVRTTIGDMFSPVVRAGIELTSTVLSDLNKLMKEFPLASSGVVWAFTGLASYKAVSRIWDIGKALVQLPSAWLQVKTAAASAEAAIQGTAGAVKIFGMSLNTALGTLGLIALACYEIYVHWEDITGAAKRAGEAISSIDRTTPAANLKVNSPDYHIRQMESMYSVPEIKPHAFGGILTRPHIGMVAEAGPEAVIPLRDKARGIPLVMRAAEILGLKPQSSGDVNTSNSILTQERQMINHVSNTGGSAFDSTGSVGRNSMTFTPTYNITVNGEGGAQSAAENIRAVIEDTMNELMSRMERVSYA